MMRFMTLFLLLGATLSAQTFDDTFDAAFDATELRGPWLDRPGKLTVTPGGLEFHTQKRGWQWQWTDIQLLDRVSPTRLDVLTYEDSALRLGRDRRYRFELAEPLPDALWQKMRARFGRPV